MKVAITGVSAANLDAVTVTVAGTVYNLRALLGLLRNAAILSDGTNFTYYIDAPFDVQAATVDGTNAATLIVISRQDEPEVSNILSATLTAFQKGKSYLISNATAAVTPIIPNTRTVVACLNDGNASAVHTASHYLYVAMEDSKPNNATSVAGFTFDVDMGAVQRNASRKQYEKQQEVQSYLSVANH